MSAEPTTASPLDRSGETLGRQAEGEWQRLRQQIELADGFWLGFLFSRHPGVIRTFRERTAALVRHRLRRVRHLRGESPQQVPALLPELLSELLSGSEAKESGQALVWLEAAGVDLPRQAGEGPGPWARAWDQLMLRLNERRERLRRHLNDGLVLVGHPDMKTRTREAAPDLWSVRSIVLEPEPVRGRRKGLSLVLERGLDRGQKNAFALSDRRPNGAECSEVLDRPNTGRGGELGEPSFSYGAPPSTPPIELLRRAAADLDAGRSGVAIERVSEAIERLRSAPDEDRANAYAILAAAEALDGDVAAAKDHMYSAVGLLSNRLDRRALQWLDFLARLAETQGDAAEGKQVLEDLLTRSRERLELSGDTPRTRQDLSISLQKIGDFHRNQGEPDRAKTAYEQSLDIARKLREQLGDSPQSLRELSVSLERLGHLFHTQGNLDKAQDLLEQSLDIRRTLQEQLGDSPRSRRELAVSLSQIGDLYREQGDLARAQTALEQSLEIARTLRDQLGDSPQTEGDLTASLMLLGDLRADQGAIDEALRLYREAEALLRRQLTLFGEARPVLRDLLLALTRLASAQEALGHHDEVRGIQDEIETIEAKLATAGYA